MNKRYANISISLLTVAGSLTVLSGDLPNFYLPNTPVSNQAAPYFIDGAVGAEVAPIEEKIRVFIMPGHEPDNGGAEYNGLKERDLNVDISNYLAQYLQEDGRYEVIIGRDKEDWNPELKAYFEDNWEEIKVWKDEQVKIMDESVKKGEIKLIGDPMVHQIVLGDANTRLYGINKWIGENDIDIAVHVHMNDYGSRRRNRPGEFSGYVVFVPENQYSNSVKARTLAQSVSDKLEHLLPQSDSKRERGGIVEDQELVAVGRYNTAVAPAILIEYGYIYESQFQEERVRDAAFKEYAYKTYIGLDDFFHPYASGEKSFVSAVLPYTWVKDIFISGSQNKDVFALQVALREEGLYPPQGKTLSDCPLSGVFGKCTRIAVENFQERYGIEGEKGLVGQNTREFLNSLSK